MAEKLFANPAGLPWHIDRDDLSGKQSCKVMNAYGSHVVGEVSPAHAKLICDEVNKTHVPLHPLLSKVEIGQKVSVNTGTDTQVIGYVLSRNMDGDKIVIELRDGTILALSHDEFVSRCGLYPIA